MLAKLKDQGAMTSAALTKGLVITRLSAVNIS